MKKGYIVIYQGGNPEEYPTTFFPAKSFEDAKAKALKAAEILGLGKKFTVGYGG